MVRYHIRINTGDNNSTHTYYFIHRNYKDLTVDEQNMLFNEAVTELNRVYKDYGRFATSVGVVKLFDSFGFEQTTPD